MFAAVHESLHGPKRRSLPRSDTSAVGGEADMPRQPNRRDCPCAQRARTISEGGSHPDNCRLVRKLAGGSAGELAGAEPCDEGGLGCCANPMGRNKVKPEQASKVLMRMPTLRSFGEGRTRGEAIDTRTHAIRRGSGYGTSEGWV